MSIKTTPLFGPLPADAQTVLTEYRHVLEKGFPLSPRHKKSLGQSIKLLSHMLTDERDTLSPGYLNAAGPLSAYLHYFLPWNIYRFVRLFRGLNLRLPENGTVLDMGAGPLTVAQALWLAFPNFRTRPLNMISQDSVPKPMRVGFDLFNLLVKATGADKNPWKLENVNRSFYAGAHRQADLVVTANTLNELKTKNRRNIDGILEKMALTLSKAMKPGGNILIIEPGVRRAVNRMSILREIFIDMGIYPKAPCPHLNKCPMAGEIHSSWCHFNIPATGSPMWLNNLSESARLPKRSVSISFMLLSEAEPEDSGRIRAVSNTFPLPKGFKGQYGCSGRGLVVLKYKDKGLYPGTLVKAAIPDDPEIDRKSGGIIVNADQERPAKEFKPKQEFRAKKDFRKKREFKPKNTRPKGGSKKKN